MTTDKYRKRKRLYQREYRKLHPLTKEQKQSDLNKYRESHRLKYDPDKTRKKNATVAHKQCLRQVRYKLKITVLTHYGNGVCACVKCGESRPECLCIDHINGGGMQHRKSVAKVYRGNMYGWLRNNNYPEGFQTLCANCNVYKAFKNNEYRGNTKSIFQYPPLPLFKDIGWEDNVLIKPLDKV